MGEVGSGTLGDRYAMFNDAQVLAVFLFASYLFSGRVTGVPVGLQQRVRPQVDSMKDYLIELTDEFRAEYKPLADLQRFHESRAEKLVKAFAEGSSDMPQEQMPTFVWTAVERLPRLAEFMQGGPGYETRFIGPLDAASKALRTAHAELIGHRLDA